MKKIVYLFGLILLGMTTSCQSDKAKEEKLATEVLALHDEVMPKMQDIMKMKKELNKVKNGLDSNSVEIKNIHQMLSALEKADKDMMDWMHAYNGGQGLYTHEEIMGYLQKEKEKMQQIKDETWKALDDAHIYLEKK